MVVHDALHQRQAEPGAFAGRLAREERVEDAGPVLGGDAGAAVADDELDGARAAIDVTRRIGRTPLTHARAPPHAVRAAARGRALRRHRAHRDADAPAAARRAPR